MKKLTITILVFLLSFAAFAQTNQSETKRLKYVTMAPDGTVALTVYDNSNDENVKLEAADAFYKYQILDAQTNEPIYTASNDSTTCKIAKSKVAAGNYNIRLYTSNFVITSRIKISAARELASSSSEESVAMNN